MTTLGKTYQGVLRKYPVFIQSVQTGLLMASGDAIAQIVIEKKRLKEYNFVRSAHFASIGLFLAGPTLTLWYRFLATNFPNPKKISTIAKKLACDQFIMAPSFICIYLSSLCFLQGKSLKETKAEVKKNYLDVVIMNYKVWPAVQVVNLTFTPLQYQVLLVQVIALFWNTYVSWKTQGNHEIKALEA